MDKLLNNNAKNIYIHIPFCLKKCNYCNFVSCTNIKEYEDLYVEKLCMEIKKFSSQNPIETVYFGGGTPNLLSCSNVEKIISVLSKSFSFSKDLEFTMEFNPKLSSRAYLKDVFSLGVNRISLGAQSFNDDILKVLGRIHNVASVYSMVEDLESVGFDNYSLDLIYGVFGQNMQILKNDLMQIKKISPKHVSTYGLKIEKGTPFDNFDKSNLPDEDLCAEMYLFISEELNQAGYLHYEISNFAKRGFVAKHNLTYWKNNEFYGFGAAAHGFLNACRYKNSDNIASYILNPFEKEILSDNEIADTLEETIFLGLRTMYGIDLMHLKEKFEYDLFVIKKDFIQELLANNYAKFDNNKLSLTENGFLISNDIIAKLLP